MNLLALKNGEKEFLDIEQFTLCHRGRKGVQLQDIEIATDVQDDDSVVFTNFGRMLSMNTTLSEGERIIAAGNPEKKNLAVLVTKNGYAKQVQLEPIKRAKTIISLSNGEEDELVSVKFTTGNDDLLIITGNGKGLRINEAELPEYGYTAQGVKAIKLKKGDYVADCEVIKENDEILVISENGIAKRNEVNQIQLHHRNIHGNQINRVDEISACKVVKSNDDILIWTNAGRVLRMKANEIPLLKGVFTKGVTAIKLDQNDYVMGFACEEVYAGRMDS